MLTQLDKLKKKIRELHGPSGRANEKPNKSVDTGNKGERPRKGKPKGAKAQGLKGKHSSSGGPSGPDEPPEHMLAHRKPRRP